MNGLENPPTENFPQSLEQCQQKALSSFCQLPKKKKQTLKKLTTNKEANIQIYIESHSNNQIKAIAFCVCCVFLIICNSICEKNMQSNKKEKKRKQVHTKNKQRKGDIIHGWMICCVLEEWMNEWMNVPHNHLEKACKFQAVTAPHVLGWPFSVS